MDLQIVAELRQRSGVNTPPQWPTPPTPDGPASSGPRSWGQVYTQVPPDQVWPVVRQVLAALQMRIVQFGPSQIVAETSISFTSWGVTHLIDLRPSTDRPGWGVVTVTAAPKMPTTLVDYGSAKKANNAILRAIPGGTWLPPLPPTPGRPPGPPGPPGPPVDRYRS